MNNIFRFVIFGVVALIVVALGSWIIHNLRSTSGKANSASEKITDDLSSGRSNIKKQLDGRVITGDDVIGYIDSSKEFSDTVFVVETDDGERRIYGTSSFISETVIMNNTDVVVGRLGFYNAPGNFLLNSDGTYNREKARGNAGWIMEDELFQCKVLSSHDEKYYAVMMTPKGE
jgi:hypothetical protein